jgi:hypothetical protein
MLGTSAACLVPLLNQPVERTNGASLFSNELESWAGDLPEGLLARRNKGRPITKRDKCRLRKPYTAMSPASPRQGSTGWFGMGAPQLLDVS